MSDRDSHTNLNFDDLDSQNTYDQAEPAKSGTFDDVPDGKYQCIIEKAWLTMTKATADKPQRRMLRWQLKIVVGQYAGRMLFRNNMIETPDNIRWLKGDLEVCGLKIVKLAELNERVGSLVGVGVEVTVKNQGKNAAGQTNMNVYLNKAIEIDRAAAAAATAGGSGAGTGGASGSGQYDDSSIPF